jgi:hypothetical protein
MLTMMSRDYDVHEWWDRTERLRQLFHDYRAELLQIGEQISQPLDARTLGELAARVDVIQRRINVLESIIRRHLARAPAMDAPIPHASQAEMRVH